MTHNLEELREKRENKVPSHTQQHLLRSNLRPYLFEMLDETTAKIATNNIPKRQHFMLQKYSSERRI